MTLKEFLSKNTEKVSALLLWVVIFAVFLSTLSPSVGFIDSGELAAVANTLGIAHPTGYPLFTLLGRIFSMLPISNEVIVRLNILSAFLTSIAAVLFFFFVIELLSDNKKNTRPDVLTASVLATLILASSTTFWSQGVSIEVYSLHLLLINMVLLFFVKAIKQQEKVYWILFSFSVGLAFTNHLTTILLAPSLLFWFFADHGLNKNAFKKVFALSIPFIVGLSVYLFIPIRAAQQPLFNWGNAQTFEKFWWHFSGKQFRVWMFSSSDAARKQLNYFFENLSNEFHIVVLIIAVLGSLVLLFSDRRKFLAIGLLFITCIAYSINYDIHDIDSYFLLAFVSISIYIAYGILKIIQRFEHVTVRNIAIGVLGGVVMLHYGGNIQRTDQHDNYLVEDYTKNILLNLPQNSIVISTQWDYFVAPSYYFQHVKSIRPDVTVLDKELFRRSWYIPQLKQMYPDIMLRSNDEVELFQQELFKFEHDLPYEYSAIEGRYASLLKSIIEKNNSVPIYVTPEIEQQYTSGYLRIPEGFLLRLSQDTSYVNVAFPIIQYRESSRNDIYARTIKSLTINSLKNRARYEQYYGRDSLARLYLSKSSEIASKFTSQVSNY